MTKQITALLLIGLIGLSLVFCPTEKADDGCATGTTISGNCVSTYECIIGDDGGLYQKFTVCCTHDDGSIDCFVTIRFIKYVD